MFGFSYLGVYVGVDRELVELAKHGQSAMQFFFFF